MLRKSVTVFAVGIITLTLLSFIGFQSQAEAKTTITVWHYYGDDEAFNGMLKRFSEAYPDIEVVAEFLPREELNKQFTIGVVSGDLPDIGMVDNPDHATYSAMGVFEDLTDLIKEWPDKDQYFEGPWKSTVYDGKNYGIPLGSNCLAIYYNEDMLAEAGVTPPQTWEELADAAAKLTQDGRYGLAISAPKNEEGTFQYLPWLLSAGATIDKLDSPEAIKSMEFLTSLVKNGSISQEVINWGQGGVEKQFALGKAAMMLNGPWNIGSVKKDAPDMKWNVIKVPKDKVYASVLGGENLGICKGANVEAAWKLLQFMATPEESEKFCIAMGYFSPRKDVSETSEYWKNDPVLRVFMDQLQYAMPRGPHPKWPEISNAISTALQEALTGTKSPADAMKDAQKKVKKALNE